MAMALLNASYPGKPMLAVNWLTELALAEFQSVSQRSVKLDPEKVFSHVIQTTIEIECGPAKKKTVQPVHIVGFDSDHRRAMALARSDQTFGAGVSIRRAISQPNPGLVQIQTASRLQLRMDLVAALIRARELMLLGQPLPSTIWRLVDEGVYGDLTQWFYQRPSGAIYNGSLKHPDIEPTQIPLSELVALVRIGLTRTAKEIDSLWPDQWTRLIAEDTPVQA
jgi:hypothetical protein